MSRIPWLPVLGLAGWLALAPSARGQVRPYIGYVYPAGGQQGTTFQLKLGGQSMDDVTEVMVTGKGVSARVVDCYRRVGPQEIQLLSEQLRELRGSKRAVASAAATKVSPTPEKDAATLKLIARIEKRIAEYCNRPASQALAGLVFIEITIAPDAEAGERELRVGTLQGVSNPMPFHVGQLPEYARKPMLTANYQVLGKEELALRKRPVDEVESRISVPCTVNGQIASGEVNRYRFEARKGQRLVISTRARQLIPYIADAVPGWFQPVLTLYDAEGRELAYDDDYQFKPDPMLLFQIPKDGEYVFAITDAIYRGREDFVYRITVGEMPVVTSIFPLGGRVGDPVAIKMKGWNLEGVELTPPAKNAGPGIYPLAARKDQFVSNRVPFAMGTLPECLEKEPNDTPKRAQKVTLPIIINGRIDRKDDWDVFQFTGRAGDTVVAEVQARRLDSPLDSVIKLTDAKGALLAFSDDREDLGAGVNTHHADSYFMVKLPADGTYHVHIGDTARNGGEEYAYRLRISAPQPDFALRVVPSSISLRSRNNTSVTVYAVRKDGFTGPIKLGLKDPPRGFFATPVTLTGTNEVTRIGFKTDLVSTKDPVSLSFEGRAVTEAGDIAHEAVAAEDRMQAFLWRHLVPANDFKALVFDPSYQPPPKRKPHELSPELQAKARAAGEALKAKNQKFSKQQVAGRVRQLTLMYQEGLFTDDFYGQKVAECEATQ
ncbi:MAG: PPC domain-containing protein [Limisphaerales bacterium]